MAYYPSELIAHYCDDNTTLDYFNLRDFSHILHELLICMEGCSYMESNRDALKGYAEKAVTEGRLRHNVGNAIKYGADDMSDGVKDTIHEAPIAIKLLIQAYYLETLTVDDGPPVLVIEWAEKYLVAKPNKNTELPNTMNSNKFVANNETKQVTLICGYLESDLAINPEDCIRMLTKIDNEVTSLKSLSGADTKYIKDQIDAKGKIVDKLKVLLNAE